MNIKLDIDRAQLSTDLTWREKVAIKILLVIFRIILPLKYDHQFETFCTEIFKQKD